MQCHAEIDHIEDRADKLTGNMADAKSVQTQHTTLTTAGDRPLMPTFQHATKQEQVDDSEGTAPPAKMDFGPWGTLKVAVKPTRPQAEDLVLCSNPRTNSQKPNISCQLETTTEGRHSG